MKKAAQYVVQKRLSSIPAAALQFAVGERQIKYQRSERLQAGAADGDVPGTSAIGVRDAASSAREKRPRTSASAVSAARSKRS